MKTFLFLLMAATISTACSENSKEQNQEQTQDYTSFVITLNKGTEQSNVTLPNIVSGYFDNKGYCHKITEHGTLSSNPTTEKLSTEEYKLTFDVDTIYVFSDYNTIIRFKDPFIIKKNKKNVFNLDEHPSAIGANKLDSMQYPQ